MDSSEPQRSARSVAEDPRAVRRPSAGRAPTARRRVRLVRGPLTIGEPAPTIEVRLTGAEPYRPDTIADGGSAFGLTVRAASVRGLQKRYSGGPRQDDLCLRAHQPTSTLVAAVADGVSGASRSDLAAALVVRHAAAAALRQLDRGTRDLDFREVFDQAAWALVEEHRRHAGDPRAGVEDASGSLATTLLVAAVAAGDAPSPGARAAGGGDDAAEGEVRVQLAAVGDSPAFTLSSGAFEPLLGESDSVDGLLGGGVSALPGAARTVYERICTLAPGNVLLLCTDGLALPLADGTGDVGRTLARELSRPPDIVDFARLLDFSRSTYDDDRSLVAIWCER
jgi:protein phosphatase 2C-like protein